MPRFESHINTGDPTTGRKFRCMGKRESYCRHWRQDFEIGKVYDEAYTDVNGNDFTGNKALLLISKGKTFYVDIDQFRKARR